MPRIHRFTLGLNLLNLVLLAGLVLSHASTAFGSPQEPPVLRGRGLEIVDNQGRIRAQILVHGPETVGGVRYPETVLFRLADPNGGPLVKLTVAANGSALRLSDGINGGNGGVEIYARDTSSFVRVVSKSDRVQMLRP
jgi:hypothetical protein